MPRSVPTRFHDQSLLCSSNREQPRPAHGPRPTLIGSFVAAAIFQSLMQSAAAAPPVLPTPCIGGACGRNSAATPFVTSGLASAVVSGNNLTVNQQSNSAILNWQSFNIGSGNSVTFNQPSATAAALNRIWSADPSVIAGQLKANGQIYLLNQNGIVFANGAQVNVGSLTASTLDVSDQTFLKGLLSGNTSTYTSGGILPPVFQQTPGSNAKGVTVEAGASIQTADAGRVMLIGTTVSNAGKISTPDGQAILAAGTTVYLASTTDPSLRGLLIAVDSGEVAANSTVTNTGTVSADRGNITLAGLVVNQAGSLSATTSVNANGSIYLVAGDADPNASASQFYNSSAVGLNAGQLEPNVGGTVNLAPGSLTQVLPDASSTTTITSAQTFYPSQVSVVGQNVSLNGNATIVAPGGQVNLTASANPFKQTQTTANHLIPKEADASRLYLDADSDIDVSGLQNVSAPASQNLIQIQLGANELQDDPLLRTGFLHGKTVTVDLSKGTPLLNQATLNSYAGTVGHSLQEVLTKGGSIELASGGDVITRAGSTQNVSGGSVAFQNSTGATSKLLGADGKVYDIGSAPNNIQYVGFADSYAYTDPRWGTMTSYSASGTVAGYLQGSAAGSISILGPNLYLAGRMLASTTPGPFQRTAATLPSGGSLSIGDSAAGADISGTRNFDAPALNLVGSLTDSLGSFDPATGLLPAPPAADLAIGDWAANGFNQFSIASNGSVLLPADTHLEIGGGGSLKVDAASVTVAGSIHSAGSAVTLRSNSFLPDESATAVSTVVLGRNAVIDVSGNWVNDSPLVTTQLGTSPTLWNGGSVTLQAAADNDVTLAPGSLIDVSGGGWVNANNKLTSGAGGSITLKAGGPLLPQQFAIGGLSLQGDLRGAGLSKGGSLSLSTAWVSVAGDPTGKVGEVDLRPDFFTQGGFGSYNITGINGLTIGSNEAGASEIIQPVQQTLVFNGSMLRQKSAAGLVGLTSLQTLSPEYRNPANVSFASTLSSDGLPGAGNLTLNRGATIAVDPGATVSLAARENMTVSGVISAPAGTINLAVSPSVAAGSTSDVDGYVASQQLLVTSSARLLAPGYAAIYTDNPKGYRTGQVLSGGTVNMVATKGSVVAQSGAIIDVSGVSGTVDVVQQGRDPVPTVVAGSAGSINIEAMSDIVLNSTLLGKAAPVAGAAGGSLFVGLDKFVLGDIQNYNINPTGTAYPTVDRNLTISGQSQLADSLPVDAAGVTLDGVGRISADTINAGGFDNVRLASSDLVSFDGNTALTTRSTMTINALEISANPGARATLSSAYVALGNSIYYPNGTGESARAYSPQIGDGTLNVTAGAIDLVGKSALSGFQQATLSSTGDIRMTYGADANGVTDFAGSLASSADLVFKAARVYPTTGTTFTINPTDIGSDPTQSASYSYAPGRVTVFPVAGGNAQLPLSALGTLKINSPSVNQYGVLMAPFGQIQLTGIGDQGVVALHAGSMTSVSGAGALIPYGSTQNGREWTYQADNKQPSPTESVLQNLPAKQVALNGADVLLDPNSKVDVSGGGDLYAYEFIAGTGGSKDVLLPGNGYTYAILPSLGSAFAPIDHQYSVGSNIPVGQQIYISGAPGLAAGYYALLPARYALLPGAYAVSLVSRNSDILQGSSIAEPNGSYLVAGQFAQAGTSILDNRTSTFLVASSAVVRTQSEYVDSYANAFFYNAAVANGSNAVNLPADAGQLALAASQQLHLRGTIGFAPAQFVAGKDAKGADITVTGVGGTASIVASQIEVVEDNATPDGALQLTTDSLNQLGASVLILGATRQAGADGDTLAVGAGSVTIANGAADPLSAPEIILAGTQTVSLAAGSSIRATGASNDQTSVFNIEGDGALLRVTSGQQATVVRTGLGSSPQGTLQIAAGSTVAGQSLILDAAGDTHLERGSSITAQAVEASSSHIALGDVPQGSAGLSITSDLLANFTNLTDLSLRSASTIDFYGNVALGTNAASGGSTLQSVTLDAAALNGYGAGDKAITAANIVLQNSGAALSSAPSADGTGRLTLTALGSSSVVPRIELGAGAKTLTGFGGVALSAVGGEIRATGNGVLSLSGSGDLTLSAARLSTDAATQQTIDNTTGTVTIGSAGSSTLLAPAGLGGRLSISGTAPAGSSAVVVSGLILMPSGNVALQALGGGDLTITGTGEIDTAGVVMPFYDTYAASNAGSVSLSSTLGGVIVQSGGVIDVSGATSTDGKVSADAGSIAVLVPQGQFSLSGTLRGSAAPGRKGGDFTLDTAGNADHSTAFALSGLNLAANGLEGNISIRDRGDSLVVVDGDNIARSFSLTADGGGISISGTVNTGGGAGQAGGQISMWSAGDLTLTGSGLLTSAAGKSTQGNSLRGGNITLGSSSGFVTLSSGATINLAGVAGRDNPGTNPDGQLRLQALYDSSSGTLKVNPIAANIRGSNPATVLVDAGWFYNNISSLGDFGDLTSAQLSTDIQAFAVQATGLAAGLTPAGASFNVQVRPWITVSSPGDLTVSSVIDLRSLGTEANNGLPIDLTLRAAGNLLVNKSISDGFVGATVNTRLPLWNLASGDSANLQLTAGADLSSASPLAVRGGIGDFVLAPATLIRTGNGNIDIGAGHEACIGCNPDGTVSSAANAQQAVIYTAGQPSTNGPATFTAPVTTNVNVTPVFGTGGGNITLSSGGDILSAPTTNLVSNWLWRQGSLKPDGTVARDTAWWVETNAFQQGIGALGGGNISVQAAGDITDLSVVIPTTGRVGVDASTSKLSADTSVINGGGDLSVRAGGNVLGGLFQADLGRAGISAGGYIGVSATTGVAPVTVLADSSFAVSAAGSVTVDGALNSTFLPEVQANRSGLSSAGLGLPTLSYFFTYGADSALAVTSAGGNANLRNNLVDVLGNAANGAQWDGIASNTLQGNDPYPATLVAASLSGDVVVGNKLTLFPSSTGNLSLLAANAVTLNATANMSEVDAAQIGDLVAPLTSAVSLPLIVGPLPNVPLHIADPEPVRIVAATGDIVQQIQSGPISLPKRADIIAGGNISNLNLSGKNLSPSDVTIVEAAQGVLFDTARDSVTNQLTSNTIGIQVAGPGFAEVLAGGGIDLGDGAGVVTTGRLNDARLSEKGATLVVSAGLGTNADGSIRAPAYDAFIGRYLSNAGSLYATALQSYEQSLFPDQGTQTPAQALAQFQSLSREQQLPFIAQVLTDELSATGLAHNTQGTSYQRGFDAISTLFPTKDAHGNALAYKGDIDMFFSQLKTAQGGDIDLLAPGGSVVVGVPNPPAALNDVKGQPLAKPPISAESNLGLLVLGQGAIHGLANVDFDVNQSRVLTLQGGDIILWASTGSIDAGKGAKTAQGAPPPVIETDPNGNIFVNPVGAVSGSGIGQLLTVQGIKAGLVNLIAPAGVVNAGEAGIRVAGDINIAATAVLNVGNIKVGGTATGLPVSDAGALSGALSGANSLGDAGKMVADQLTSSLTAGNNLQQLTESLTPTFITVRMFCLGVQCDAQ